MLKKTKNIIYFILSFIFIIFIISFYFSDENIRMINKSRSLYSVEIKSNIKDLPLLKNDTINIFDYSDDIDLYKKNKKKYLFWDLIEKN